MYFPRKRMIVHLAPAAMRKEGPAYDLPVAMGALISSGQLPPENLGDAMVIGEISLNGGVRHLRGVLPMATLARPTSHHLARRAGGRRQLAPSGQDLPGAQQSPSG